MKSENEIVNQLSIVFITSIYGVLWEIECLLDDSAPVWKPIVRSCSNAFCNLIGADALHYKKTIQRFNRFNGRIRIRENCRYSLSVTDLNTEMVNFNQMNTTTSI